MPEVREKLRAKRRSTPAISRDQLLAIEWARGRLRQRLMNLVSRWAGVDVAQVRTPRGGLLRFERAGGGALRYYTRPVSKRWKSRRPGRWVDATTMTSLRDLMDADSASHELEAEHLRLWRAAQARAVNTTQPEQQEATAC